MAGKYILLALFILTYIDNSHCFDVFWNIPSQTCQKFGIYINASQYGIVQNTDDVFYGDKVSIFYSPGKFPWLNEGKPVDGGIPQNGNLTKHQQVFTDKATKQLPTNFKGVAVLDFEAYYPSYWMSPIGYRGLSRAWTKRRHPTWSNDQIEAESRRTFNESSRDFFEILLLKGREMHPEALWGYYHYPYCHNYGPQATRCDPAIMDHNDQMNWLIKASTALYPSIYIFKNSGFSPMTRRMNAYVKIKEAMRVRRGNGNKIPILPYFWYRYHDSSEYLTALDITNTLGLSKVMNLEGVVMWGSAYDLRTKEMCQDFKTFLEEKLGPVAWYVSRFSRSLLSRVINSRRLLRKFSLSALREASLRTNHNAS